MSTDVNMEDGGSFPFISSSISKESMDEACDSLSKVIGPKKDNTINLNMLHFFVKSTLSQDESLNLATREQFGENVKNHPEGEDEFIRKAVDIKSYKDLGYLFTEGVFYNSTSRSDSDINQETVEAAVNSWTDDFKGSAADSLLLVITDLLRPQPRPYARSTCIINSSGTGKSRMVDEVSKAIITVPMCLRKEGSMGFPPPDDNLREYFRANQVLSNQLNARKMLHGIIYGILTVTQAQLGTFALPGLAKVPSTATVGEYAKARQKELAAHFRNFMTEGQSFGRVNSNRQEFYRKVIEAASIFGDHAAQLSKKSHKESPTHVINQMGDRVRTAAKNLYNFVDPQHCLFPWPLVILSFDEPHVLTDGVKEGEWSMFTELRRILQRLDDLGFFSIFLSTAGNFRLLSPDNIKSDPSNRVKLDKLLPFHPITEVSFDCLARPASEFQVSLETVVSIDWIAHLGRPLFGSQFDNLIGNEEGKEMMVMEFAKQKLLNGNTFLITEGQVVDAEGSLACLAMRFSLEFNEDAASRDVSYTQVERHMRICLAATTSFKTLVTCSSSEPLLAEAAFLLMSSTNLSPAKLLANHANLCCIDRGRRGELVASLILMQARDKSLPSHLPLHSSQRWVEVMAFMQALLAPQASKKLLDSLPIRWCEGEADTTFSTAFKGCHLWFNHVIKVEDSSVIKPDFLWKFVLRGAMVVCKDNQQGIDIILPVVWPELGPLSRHTVSSIIIQVKNSTEFSSKISTKLFNAMDPLRLGLLHCNDNVKQRPIIRMVLALASSKGSVSIPARPERRSPHNKPGSDRPRASTFTAFDIWCAGLSKNTYGQSIVEDIDAYKKLLDHSKQLLDVFNVSDSYNLEPDTKKVVGMTRQRMAPLIRCSGHNDFISKSESGDGSEKSKSGADNEKPMSEAGAEESKSEAGSEESESEAGSVEYESMMIE